MIKTLFQNVAGLNNGADVRVGKKDSLAAIKSEGLLGDNYLEISFGSMEAAKVKDGDTIASEPPFDISNMIGKANQILDTAQSAVAHIGESANHLQSITAKIDMGKGSVGELINNKSVYNQANKAATDLRENMEALKHNFLVRGFFKKRGYEDETDKPDTAKLKNQKTLNDAGKYLEQTQFGLVVISACAGTKGDSKQDLKLSEARPAVVRDYLVNTIKLDDSRIKTIGLGKADTMEESGKVQISVYLVGTSVPPPRQRRQYHIDHRPCINKATHVTALP